jgi:hypothetical protein
MSCPALVQRGGKGAGFPRNLALFDQDQHRCQEALTVGRDLLAGRCFNRVVIPPDDQVESHW